MEEYVVGLFDRLFLLGIGFALGGIFYMYMYSRHIGKPWKIKPPASMINPEQPPVEGEYREGIFYYCCLDCQVFKKREV